MAEALCDDPQRAVKETMIAYDLTMFVIWLRYYFIQQSVIKQINNRIKTQALHYLWQLKILSNKTCLYFENFQISLVV